MGRNKILDNVLLDNIAMAMNDGSYETEWYLDTEKATTTFISDYDEELTEDVMQMIEADEKGERFILIPEKPSRDGWNLMNEFIHSLDDIDETTRRSLFRSIEGRGAFRRFKDIVYEFGIQDRWFEYSGRKERKEVLEVALFSESYQRERYG